MKANVPLTLCMIFFVHYAFAQAEKHQMVISPPPVSLHLLQPDGSLKDIEGEIPATGVLVAKGPIELFNNPSLTCSGCTLSMAQAGWRYFVSQYTKEVALSLSIRNGNESQVVWQRKVEVLHR